MRRSPRINLAAAALALAGLQPDVSVTYEAPKSTTLGEPVVITATIRNHSSHAVRLDLGWNRIMGFKIVVERPDGTRTTPTITPDGLGRVGRLTLAPAGEVEQPLVLDDWTSLDAPGLYRVEVTLSAPLETTESRRLPSPGPDVLEIRVQPRDEAALTASYQRLADQFLAAPAGSVDRHNRGHVLRYLRDPVAVPIFGRILDLTADADPMIIEALRRMGSLEARQLLLDAAGSANQDRALMAADALRRFGKIP